MRNGNEQALSGDALASLSGLTRRSFLLTGTAAVSAMRALPADPACVLTPEGEEGPYYVNYLKVRQNLTEGKPGLPLRLRIAVVDSKTCAPLPGAAVDIWHCDASGVYSGFTAMSPDGGPGGPGGRGRGFRSGLRQGPPIDDPDNPPPPPPGFGGRGGRGIDETRFLRGVQLSDKTGLTEFATLYPGWYAGRAIHIHMKVRVAGAIAGDTVGGGHVSHTGQIYLPEEITERVAKREPYAKRLNVHRTTQEEDGIFRSQHGASCIAAVSRLESRSDEGGFVAAVTLAVDPNATPAPVGMGGGRGRGRG